MHDATDDIAKKTFFMFGFPCEPQRVFCVDEQLVSCPPECHVSRRKRPQDAYGLSVVVACLSACVLSACLRVVVRLSLRVLSLCWPEKP